MKSILRLTIGLILCTYLHEKVTAQSIYDTSPSTSATTLAKSFSNWFVAQEFNTLTDAITACEALDIPLYEVAKSLRIPLSNEKDFTDLRFELIYFEKQDSLPMAKVGQALQVKNSIVKELWNQRMMKTKQVVWIVHSEKRDQFYLEASVPDKKWRIKQAIASSTAAFETPNGPLFLEGLKINKKKPSNPSLRQLILKKEKSAQTIQLTDASNQSVILAFPAFKDYSPYIKSFFATDPTVWENERTSLTWEVWGCEEVQIDQSLGAYPPAWQVTVAPESSIAYRLTASNGSGKVEKEVVLDVTRIVLTKATATFFQSAEGTGKEKISEVIAEVFTMDDQVVASLRCGSGVSFEGANTYWGPFDYAIDGSPVKKKLIHGKLRFRLQAEEKDPWIFSPIVLLTFSDGTSARLYGFGNKTLDQNVQEVIIPF
jgi:hypothetical protein